MADRDLVRLESLAIHAGNNPLVHDVNLTLSSGELVALVGASGSGKTLSARAMVGLVHVHPGVVSGDLVLRIDGKESRPYRERNPRRLQATFEKIRGRAITYLPQDSQSALDPLWTVQRHLLQVLQQDSTENLESHALSALERAGFSHPAEIMPLYPHELSGGMAQRVCISLGLARGSRFLLADELTTGLDPSVQHRIMLQVAGLRQVGVGVLVVTHDLRLVHRFADRVVVLDGGRVVEACRPADLSDSTQASTRRLLDAVGRVEDRG
ncbi:MAG: ATP-binding cassette domain-containing protein [Myxococcota bacterium]|nr:ATP-binding cassette domain-containing protein [Myxococcota bacterium]